jgi:cation diffusion facilitator CzcD-associated flavoprotein CzcO
MTMYSANGTHSPDAVEVLIVGAGFSGLSMAIKLRRAGMESFIVIEKSNDIGGTWWANQYPGCACDIPAHLYSFSFDCNPDWSRMYAPRQEIHRYLKSCAQRHGVMPHIRLNTELREAVWDEATALWRVTTANGMTIHARVLVSAVGALHIPNVPQIKGLKNFGGPSFHSMYWDKNIKLEGKKVAVIGTGASAIQIVPKIAPGVERLYLFQRTPAWILPRLDFEISESWKRRFRRIPLLARLFRNLIFWKQEVQVLGLLRPGWLRRRGAKMARNHLQRQITNPKLRASLTPRYEIGCKRVLLSSDFYPSLQRPNVELVTEAIQEAREHSIVTADGKERGVDVIVFATGFRVSEMLRDLRVVGRGGVEIHNAWKDRTCAYLGVTVSSFPNFFILLGPNTGLGHNSVVLMIEAQVRYIMSCLRLMRRRESNIMELRPETQWRFIEHLRKRLAGTVWESGGCVSWYQDGKTGENCTIWPGSVIDYMWRTYSVSASDYKFSENIAQQRVDSQRRTA